MRLLPSFECCLALAAGLLHCWEVSCYHHELNTLPVAEQKIAALKTENAFYYSYYEEVVVAPDAISGVRLALFDERSEAPDTINAVQRFNIYQELICGLLYRVASSLLGTAAMPDAWYFFRGCSYALQGLGHAALFRLLASLGGDGLRGALLPAIALGMLLFLHRRDTGRIHDVGMLNLRENWAMPVLLCQALALERLLRKSGQEEGRCLRRWTLCGVTTLCLLLWQFSAFAMMLQVAAVFACALLFADDASRQALGEVVSSHLLSLLSAALLLFGNELILHHALLAECAAIALVLRLRKAPKYRALFWLDGALALLLFGAMRALQNRMATADEHLAEIFAAKAQKVWPGLLPQQGQEKEATFNARLYMAVSVFDFMDWGTFAAGFETKSYEAAGLAALGWLGAALPFLLQPGKEGPRAPAMARLALLLQLLFFLALGGFISRLKVLGAPLLQLLAALAFAPGTWQFLLPQEGAGGLRRFGRAAMLALLMLLQLGHVALLARRLPFLEGREAHREMSWPDADRAELADWLNRHLRDEREVLVTSMPLSAELRLSTPFRFAIHPQFEQRALRDRVQEIYKFYQCTPAEEMAEVLRRYNSSIIVLEYKRCDFSPFLLDERPDLNCEKGQRPWKDLFCPVAHVSPLFSLLFANAGFSVHRLLPAGTAPQPAKLRRMEDMEVWRPMLQSCLKDAPADCGARIADLAAMLHSKLNQPKVADGLFAWVRENAPGDGVAQYLMAHHLDYNLGRPQDAGGGYAQAAKLAPNNALVLREYLMWLDLEAKDNRTLESILRPRRFSKGSRLSLLELEDVALACEASVPAWELFRDLDWAEELWGLAVARGIGSSCVKNNWPLHNGGRELEADLGQWGKFSSSFWHRRLRSEFVTSTGNGARFRARARGWRLGTRLS